MKEVDRPRKIDILISMRRNQDHPYGMGAFGKIFDGVKVGLKFQPHVLSCHNQSRLMGCFDSTTLRAAQACHRGQLYQGEQRSAYSF